MIRKNLTRRRNQRLSRRAKMIFHNHMVASFLSQKDARIRKHIVKRAGMLPAIAAFNRMQAAREERLVLAPLN
jgi:hypothetical protein